jgi:transposase-like protein
MTWIARPVEERFWERVEKTDSCWLWKGTILPSGYGRLTSGSRRKGTYVVTSAHRLSYELHHGAVPTGKNVLHRCDVKHCVNPAHLYVGTAKDNADDRHARNAGWHRNRPRGTAVHTATLTDEQALAIRERYAQGGVTYAQVAAEFGTTRVVVGKVVRGTHWAHIGGPTLPSRHVGRQARVDHDAIRAEYGRGGVSQYALAAKYGASQSLVSKVVNHRL